MAQFNSLLVTGDSRFLNPINGNARNGVYTVVGTQAVSTGSWTGVIPVPALYDGLKIAYYLPYAGSGNATLNLTLSNGTTTGAINCYYRGNSRLTTHYGAGDTIMLTYFSAGSISVSGNPTTDNRWIAGQNYTDGNDGAYYDRFQNNRIKAGSNKIFPYTIICQLPDGRWESIVTSSSTGTSKSKNAHGFLFGQIALMYANATYNENVEVGNNYFWTRYGNVIDHRYSFNTANDSTNGTTAIKPVYLVGTISSDGLYYLDTKWWTQTLPSTADGKIYTYIGDAYDYYRMTFTGHGKSFVYTNGHLREFSQDAGTVNGLTVQTAVPANAKFTDTTYESKAAASGGTAVSLCTTGEKYTWNNKSNLTLGTTSTTALKGDTKYAGSSTAGGSAKSATQLDTQFAGSATQPCYFENGVPEACTYSLNKTVPSDAVFTDTTYELKSAVSGGTDLSLVTTGEKYLWNNKVNSNGAILRSPLVASTTTYSADNMRGQTRFLYQTHGVPHTGTTVAFDSSSTENYTLQLNANYGGATSNARFSFRTRQGDTSKWSNWLYCCPVHRYNTRIEPNTNVTLYVPMEMRNGTAGDSYFLVLSGNYGSGGFYFLTPNTASSHQMLITAIKAAASTTIVSVSDDWGFKITLGQVAYYATLIRLS